MFTRNILGLLGGSLFFCLAPQAFAEETTTASSKMQWNAYLDFYYQHSPQGHVSPSMNPGPNVVEGRFFDRYSDQMTLSMAEVSFKKSTEKLQLKMDLAFGEMVDELSGGSSAASLEATRHLTQATLTYQAHERLKFTLGKFYSYMGMEVVKAKDNWQYSRSYSFNYGIPFWHEGVSASYVMIPEQLTGSLYVLNGWDGRVSHNVSSKVTLGASLSYAGVKDLIVNYNYIGGSESTDNGYRSVNEVNALYAVTPRFSLALDYTAGSQTEITEGDARWQGLTLYLKMAFTDFYTLSPRYELFDDSDKGFAIAGGLSGTGTRQKITSWTLSNNFTLDQGLEARLELRSDKSDSDLYFKDKDGEPTDHQESVALALLYGF
ncbi:hypothetical protein D3C87_162680 [compost metagenome]